MVHLLVAEGTLALDDDVRRYVPALGTEGHRITIEQVLTHTGGLPNLVDLVGFDRLARQDYSVDSLLALARGMPLPRRGPRSATATPATSSSAPSSSG